MLPYIPHNIEVRALGIQMGTPLFQIKHLVKEHNIQVYSSNFSLYGDLSSRVMTLLSNFTPDLEIYSIDEAFLGLSGFPHLDLHEYGVRIRKTIKQCLGLPVCVGIAPTKTLAKIANRVAKKELTTEGVVWLDTKEKQVEALQKVAVEDVWGIGRAYAIKLKSYNIHTAYELSKATIGWVKQHLGGIVGERLWYELNATSCLQLEQLPPPKKSLTYSRSLGKEVETVDELIEVVSTFTSRLGEKLRKNKQVAGSITVFIQTNPFGKHSEPYSAGIAITLPVASSDTAELIEYACMALRKIYKANKSYKKVGIMLTGLMVAKLVQTHLFDERCRSKSSKLMETLDKINTNMGRDTVIFASAGFKKEWKPIASMCTPRYTTRWEDIMVVKA